MAVTTAEELGKRVQNGDDNIEIEGRLAEKVIRIKATGNVSWAVALGAIGIAVLAILTLPTSTAAGPVGPAVEGFVASGAAAGAVAILGVPAAVAAISMAVAVKSKSVLTKLRNNYDIVKKTGNRIVLSKK